VPISYGEPGISAHNVKVTDEYIVAEGVCSCSLCTDRHHHTRAFYNLNPRTGNHKVCYFEEGPISWTSPEGLWVARDTDMDFCLVHGKSHDQRGVYLIPYNGNIEGYIFRNGYWTGEKIQNTTQTILPAMEGEYIEIQIKNQKCKIKKDLIYNLKNKKVIF
jgi:hypothetical protein